MNGFCGMNGKGVCASAVLISSPKPNERWIAGMVANTIQRLRLWEEIQTIERGEAGNPLAPFVRDTFPDIWEEALRQENLSE